MTVEERARGKDVCISPSDIALALSRVVGLLLRRHVILARVWPVFGLQSLEKFK